MIFEKRTHRVSYTRKMKLSPSIHHYPRWKAVILKSSVNYASHPVIVSALLLVPHADASRQSASQWRKSLKVSRYLLCRALLLYVDTQNKEGGNYGNKSFAESSSSRRRPSFLLRPLLNASEKKNSFPFQHAYNQSMNCSSHPGSDDGCRKEPAANDK